MRNAQEQALLALACGRGLLAAEQRARLEGSASAGSGEHLAQRLIQERLLPPQALAGLLRELAGGAWRCAGCQTRLGWPQLSQLPGLRCRCGGELVSLGSGASSSAVGRLQHSQATVAGPAPEGRASAAARSSALGQADTRAGTRQPSTSGLGQVRALPRRLGAFTLEKQLGRGSCATVYLGRRDGVAREFAVKVVDDPDPDDEELLARFRREVDVASRIRHPGVIPVFEAGEEGGSHYYVMDYCPGVTLKERLKSGGPLPPAEAAALVASLARAIEAAHAAGVIHRDLKPANIIIEDGTRQPRITDFGMARDERHLRQLTDTGDVLGTPYYMAPEQFRGERDLDRRIDVYALGVILYEALTGRRPYDGPTALALKRRVEQGDPVPPSQHAPEVPAELEEVCLRAMAVEPDERPGSAAELAEELEALAAPAGRQAQPAGRLVVVAVAGVLLGLLAAGGAVAVVASRGGLAPEPAPAPPPPPGPDPREVVARRLSEAAALAADQGRKQAPLPWTEVEAAFQAAEEAAGRTGPLREQVELARAGHHLRRGQWDEALRRAQGLDSDAAVMLCAEALEKLSRRDEAARTWKELAGRAADRVGGLVASAARARLEGASETARERAAVASEKGPEEPAAWRELARASLALGLREQAQPAIDRLDLLAPDDPEAALLRARLYLAQESFDGAQSQLARAAALTGQVADPARLALEARVCLSQEGGLEQARKALQAALAADPRQPDALVHQALLLLLEEKLDQAKVAWKAVGEEIGRGPRLAVSREYWGGELLPYLRLLEAPEWGRGGAAARAWVEQLAARAPGEARTALSTALTAAIEGKAWTTIAPAISQALGQAPADPALRREAARLALGRGQGSEALRLLEQLPADPERERMRAEALWMSGRPGAAAVALEEATRRDPQGVEGRCAAAEALWLDRREAEALAQLERALELDPSHFPSHVLRAMTLYSLRRQSQEVMAAIEAAHELRGFLDARLLVVGRYLDEFQRPSRDEFRRRGPGGPDGRRGMGRGPRGGRGGRGGPGRGGPFGGGAPPMGVEEGELIEAAFVQVVEGNGHAWFLGRDVQARRGNDIPSLRQPDRDWDRDAYYHLVTGRLHLNVPDAGAQAYLFVPPSKTPEDAKRAWRRARQLDSELRFSAADLQDLKKRVPEAVDVDSWLAR